MLSFGMRFQLDIWVGCSSNLAASSGKIVCSFLPSIATLALKDVLNFLLVVFHIDKVELQLNFLSYIWGVL